MTSGQWGWGWGGGEGGGGGGGGEGVALKINGAESVLTYKRQQGGEKLYFPVCKLV